MSGVVGTADLTVGVLALQGDVREHRRALVECGVAVRLVRRPTDLDDIDALVIPGGESTTMSKLAIDTGVLEPIRSRIKGGMPAYGSCAGMIMLANEVLDGRPDQQTFGGIDMAVRRNAFGRQVDSFEAPIAMPGLPGEPPRPGEPLPGGSAREQLAGEPPGEGRRPGEQVAGEPAGEPQASAGPLRGVFIRAPWVERVGPGVAVLGRVAAGRGAGRIVAVRQGNLLATAFHPELTGDLRVHRLFVDIARAAR